MSGTAYKALGFLAWRGGLWYARRRLGGTRRVGAGLLAAGAAVAVSAAVVAQRRNGNGA